MCASNDDVLRAHGKGMAARGGSLVTLRTCTTRALSSVFLACGPKTTASTIASDRNTLAANASGARACDLKKDFGSRAAARDASRIIRSSACGGNGEFSRRYWRDRDELPLRYS